MNEHCSAVILNKLPRKLGDPGKFLIPCEFPGMDECLALADLGASINLMPFSVWEKLSLPALTPTCMTLELADRSISKPMGIAKDISVKVGVFHFPADFVVVDFEPDPRVPPPSPFNSREIDVIDMACEEYSQEVLGFTDIIASGNSTPHDDPIVATSSPTLTPFGDSDFCFSKKVDLSLKELKLCEAKIIESFRCEPTEVELKNCPPHLEMPFLEGDKQGINPEFCTHKILMKDYYTAVNIKEEINPKIHDVIKKEVEKTSRSWIDYPISDRMPRRGLLRWVLLLQELTSKLLLLKEPKNLAADHLSRLENTYENVNDPNEDNDSFPLETGQIQMQSQRSHTEESAVKTEPELKNTIECNLYPSDGPGKPNSISMKSVKTKWALNQLQQPICVQLTKTVKTLKAQS
ncbi:reverse transcriptase domain-containing protein [Tanacetum coccineum]